MPGEDSGEFRHRRGEQAFEIEVLVCCVVRIGGRLRAGERGGENKDECKGGFQGSAHKVGERPPGIAGVPMGKTRLAGERFVERPPEQGLRNLLILEN